MMRCLDTKSQQQLHQLQHRPCKEYQIALNVAMVQKKPEIPEKITKKQVLPLPERSCGNVDLLYKNERNRLSFHTCIWIWTIEAFNADIILYWFGHISLIVCYGVSFPNQQVRLNPKVVLKTQLKNK